MNATLERSVPVSSLKKEIKTSFPTKQSAYVAPLTAICSGITALLHAVEALDESEDANTSARISRAAETTIATITDLIDGGARDLDSICNEFYDAEALIVGALRVGGDMTRERDGLLMAARAVTEQTASAMLDVDLGTDCLARLIEISASLPLPADVMPQQFPRTLPPAAVITRNTPIQQGGQVAHDLMREGTWEIEQLAVTICRIMDDLPLVSAETGRYPVRALSLRIKGLNSLLMSFLSEDDVTIADADNRINGEPTVLLEGGAA